jgi:cardiolipin hydrolase
MRIPGLTISTICLFGALANAADVETQFGSEGSVRNVYVNAINGAEYEIKVAMDYFTDYTLAQALINAAKYGREVYVIVDGDRENLLKGAAIGNYLRDGGIGVAVNRSDFRLFDRFMIIDGKKVIVGSYPFVEDAGDSPMNDVIVISDVAIAAAYAEHFDYIWNLTK